MASGNPSLSVPTRLDIAIDDAAVAKAIDAARDFSATTALPSRQADRLAIIVEELVANLVEHAELPVGARLTLAIAHRVDHVTITLTDPAAPFDPRLSSPAADIPVRGGNAGLTLVCAFALITGYDRTNGCNRLRLSMPLLDAPTPAL